MRRWLVELGAVAVFAVVAPLTASAPAGAEVSGNCTATIAGTSVGSVSSSKVGDAIKVNKDDVVQVGAQSSAPIDGYKVQMEFAGIRWTVAKGKGDGNSWSKQVKVKTYSRYGVGLYKVIGVSSGAGACTGAALVNVTGKSPLSTAAGQAGLVLAALGVLGLVGAIFRASRPVGVA